MTATENQRPSVEETTLGVVLQIESHRVEASAVMDILQSCLTHGDELTLVVGGARRLGIPFHLSRPQHILFAMAHPVDATLQVLVVAYRYMLCPVVIALESRKEVLAPEFRIARLFHEIVPHGILQHQWFLFMSFQVFLSRLEDMLHNSCQTHFPK